MSLTVWLESDLFMLSLYVGDLLWRINLTQYQNTFMKEHISGEILCQCTREILQVELGMASKVHCLRLLYSGDTSAMSLES